MVMGINVLYMLSFGVIFAFIFASRVGLVFDFGILGAAGWDLFHFEIELNFGRGCNPN